MEAACGQSCDQWHCGKQGVVASFLDVCRVCPSKTLKVSFSLRGGPVPLPTSVLEGQKGVPALRTSGLAVLRASGLKTMGLL